MVICVGSEVILFGATVYVRRVRLQHHSDFSGYNYNIDIGIRKGVVAEVPPRPEFLDLSRIIKYTEIVQK